MIFNPLNNKIMEKVYSVREIVTERFSNSVLRDHVYATYFDLQNAQKHLEHLEKKGSDMQDYGEVQLFIDTYEISKEFSPIPMKKVIYSTCYGGFGFSEEFITKFKGLNLSHWERDNQYLIAKAIEFGLDKASGDFASLAVEEIPAICSFEIDEYDGAESVRVYLHVTMEELKSGLSQEKLEVLEKFSGISIVIGNEPKYDSAGFCMEDREPLTAEDCWDGDESDKCLQ